MSRRTNFFNKKFPKIFTIIFLILIILQTGAFVFSSLFYTPVKAQTKWTNPTDNFFFTVFSEPKECPDDPTKTCVPWIGEYIGSIYNYAIGIVGILAAIVLMFGGVIWLTAGGSPERVKEAKAWIGASLSGLVLMLCSYMILYQINPDLVKLNPLKIKLVEKIPIEVRLEECRWGVGYTDYQFVAESCKDIAEKEKWENPATWETKESENCKGIKPAGNYVLCCCPPREEILKTNNIGVKPSCPSGGPYTNCVSLTGINNKTLEEIVRLGVNCTSCAANEIFITGGTEPGHSTGTYSHANGYKVDLRPGTNLDNYIKDNFKKIGTRSDGAEQWESPSGAIYAFEDYGDAHWDVLVK
ncbi:MAG: pilin [Patescibacteria group bacterium]|nr:pilin [Patescibacteria group bacterium]